MFRGMGVAAIAILSATSAGAAIEGAGPAGFTAVETAHVAAPPDRTYAMLVQPARWWNPRHTFSGDAANLALDARAGGCWCETLPGGGSVEHLRVIYVVPGKTLRLTGALGPLQPLPVLGVLTFALTPAGEGTDVKVTYALAGAGLGDLSGPVDNVLADQTARLKAAVETAR